MKNNRHFLKKSYIALCLSTVFLGHAQANTTDNAPALAESANDEIESITIIGKHQAYRGDFASLETPQSELSLDAEILLNAGALDLTEALDLSTSVARQNNFGGLWNSFAVRGFVGDENLPSNYLVNGFNAGRGFGGSRDLSGIEAVEVLKGPRAALFGRGEPGGTINLITKRAHFEQEGEVRLSAGSFDTYRTDFDYNTPLSDELAVRIVGFYEDARSFRDTIETEKEGLSPSIIWTPNESTQVSYELEYSHQEIPFDRGVIAIDGVLGLIPQSRFLGEPDDGPIETNVYGHQLEYQHDFNDNWSVLVGFNSRNTSLDGVATETSFVDVVDDEINRFRRDRDYDASYRVFRAEVTGNFELAGFENRIIVGIDSDRFENDQITLRARGEQFINVFNPVYGAITPPELAPNIDRVEIQKSNGIFFQDQISLTDKLDIRIGARFDDYEQELNNRRSDAVLEQTESRINPQFGIVYQSSDALSFYAAYGENFRPLSGADVDGNGFEPNESTSIEAGVKFTLNDGALEGTFTVFQLEQENIVTITDASSFNGSAIGEAKSQGIELDLNGEIAQGLMLWASYTYIDAQTENDFFEPNFGRIIESGTSLLNIPEHQANIQLAKSTELLGQPFEYGASVLYVSERNGFFGTDFELPSYTLTRAFVSYDVNEAVTVRLDIENLFDEEYFTNSFADVWVQPGAPSNVTLSGFYRF